MLCEAPPELLATAEPVYGEPQEGAALLAALLAGRPDWHADAACREHPEVNFFPPKGGDVRPAKLICASCLVKVECRSWALAQDDHIDGIWAGTSRRQRKQMRDAVQEARPVPLIERVSGLLAAHPDEAFTASSIRKRIGGHPPTLARALADLVEGGYASVNTGGIIKGKHYPVALFYRHVALYTGRGAVTVVATAPGRITAA